MNELESKNIQCPYCGEQIDLVIDCSETEQDYIEDCQVCCRPINVKVFLNQNGDVVINVSHENE